MGKFWPFKVQEVTREVSQDKASQDEVSQDEAIKLPKLTSQERIQLLVELPAHPSMADIQKKTIDILQRRTKS